MTSLPGFIGNVNEYNQLINWIKQPNSIYGKFLCKECILIISGSSGCGKSHGIRMAINECNKQVCYINKDECINSKDFKELVVKQTTANILDQFNIINQFNNLVINKENELGTVSGIASGTASGTALGTASEFASETVIFIDDIDTLLSVDRSFVNNFNTLITSNTIKSIKIIISCITSELKIILKSIIFGQIILLKTPNDNDIKTYLSMLNTNTFNIHSSNNIEYTKIINDCINFAKGDLSVAQNIYNINCRKISIEKQTNNINDTLIQTDIFPEVAKIYYMENRTLIRKIVEQDPWLHPLRFHENIIHEFKQRKGSKELKDKTYINILENLCKWDQLMVSSKGGDITCAVEQACNTIMLLTPIKRKKIAEPPMDEFTRMFNYLSLRKKNMVSLYEGNFIWETIGSSRKKIYEGYIRKENNTNKKKTRTANNTKKLPI